MVLNVLLLINKLKSFWDIYYLYLIIFQFIIGLYLLFYNNFSEPTQIYKYLRNRSLFSVSKYV